MIKRIVISFLLIAVSTVIGLCLPSDLVRHPIAGAIISMPRQTDVIACYTLRNGERIPFDGTSHFGDFWAWRRRLPVYNGLDIGNRDATLEEGADNPHTGYLVYHTPSGTKAITYARAAGWTSGAILGEFKKFDKDDKGLWRNVETYRDASNSLLESIFRLKIFAVALVIGIVAAVTWNVRASRCNRQTKSSRQQGGSPYSSPVAGSESGDL
jgi:hypothetical protein